MNRLGAVYMMTVYLVLGMGAAASAQTSEPFLCSYTLMANVGIDVNIPVGESTFLVVGAEYFNRRVRELAGFIDGEQWYISGDGIGFRLGILWRE